MNKRILSVVMVLAMMFASAGCSKPEPGLPDSGLNTETVLTQQEEKEILGAVDKLNEARDFYFIFLSGPVGENSPALSRENNPYRQTHPNMTYLQMYGDYATSDSFMVKAGEYYSQHFIDTWLLSQFETKDEGRSPYVIEHEGKLYCNSMYGLGWKAVLETEKARITEYNGETAKITVPYHHPMDDRSNGEKMIELVKEKGRWLYNGGNDINGCDLL